MVWTAVGLRWARFELGHKMRKIFGLTKVVQVHVYWRRQQEIKVQETCYFFFLLPSISLFRCTWRPLLNS